MIEDSLLDTEDAKKASAYFWKDLLRLKIFVGYPLFYERNKEFLNLCSASVLTHQFKVRTHPADTRSSDFMLPAKWAFDASDKCSIFNNVAIIITSESEIAV